MASVYRQRGYPRERLEHHQDTEEARQQRHYLDFLVVDGTKVLVGATSSAEWASSTSRRADR